MDSLLLLSGLPVDKGNFKVYPPKLKDIAEIGENLYKKHLSLLTFNKTQLVQSVSESVTEFDIIVVNCNQDEDYRISVEKAFEFFLKEKVHFLVSDGYGLFYIGENKLDEKFIHRGNYSDVVKDIKAVTCIGSASTEQDIMADMNIEDPLERERIRKIRERLKKAKARISAEESSSSGVSDLELADIVSSLCGIGPNLNILQVWGLSLYQFYNQFQRIKLVDDYKIQIQSMMAGAKIDNLKHWLTKIEEK